MLNPVKRPLLGLFLPQNSTELSDFFVKIVVSYKLNIKINTKNEIPNVDKNILDAVLFGEKS